MRQSLFAAHVVEPCVQAVAAVRHVRESPCRTSTTLRGSSHAAGLKSRRRASSAHVQPPARPASSRLHTTSHRQGPTRPCPCEQGRSRAAQEKAVGSGPIPASDGTLLSARAAAERPRSYEFARSPVADISPPVPPIRAVVPTLAAHTHRPGVVPACGSSQSNYTCDERLHAYIRCISVTLFLHPYRQLLRCTQSNKSACIPAPAPRRVHTRGHPRVHTRHSAHSAHSAQAGECAGGLTQRLWQGRRNVRTRRTSEPSGRVLTQAGGDARSRASTHGLA